MYARIVGSYTLLMATASGKLAVVKILTVNGFSALEKVTFSSGVIPCLSWSLKKAGELMGPSVNTDFLDDLREMLGDEQFTALIAKYHEKRIRLPSRERAETITRRNSRIRKAFYAGAKPSELAAMENLDTRQICRIINGK